MPASHAARSLRRRSAISRKACWFACRSYLDDLPLKPRGADLEAALAAHYATSPFVRVVPAEPSGKMEPESLNGTNDLELRVFANEARRHAIMVAKLDNLGKGASGAAMQNLELMLHAA